MNRVFVLGVLLSAVLAWSSLAVCADTGREESSPDYVGSETCRQCHEDYYDSFSKNRHAFGADSRTPGAGWGCETCHGPGGDHADSEGETPIRLTAAETGEGVPGPDAACLQCHSRGRLALWPGSEHQRWAVSCSDCHRIHNNYPGELAFKSEEETCRQCHKDIRAQLSRLSHHPLREGKMICSDCHNSHGTLEDKFIDAPSVNQKCFECHAEKRGPFLWEHPPVTEDCMTCHTPHGSARDGLLNARAPLLCQRCHANVGHPGEVTARSIGDADTSVYRSLSNITFYRACLNCHTAIHGTNHPSGKSLVR